jgi:hypothetical protein
MKNTAKREKVFDATLDLLSGSLGYIYAMEDFAKHAGEFDIEVWTLRQIVRSLSSGITEAWAEAAQQCTAMGGPLNGRPAIAAESLNEALEVFRVMREHTMNSDVGRDENAEARKVDAEIALAMLRSALVGFNAATLAMEGVDTYQLGEAFKDAA